MSTSQSPLRVLKAQADIVARRLKAAERGERIDTQFAKSIEMARGRSEFKCGIVMDDKVIIVTVPWSIIRESSEVALAAWILKYMKGESTQ